MGTPSLGGWLLASLYCLGLTSFGIAVGDQIADGVSMTLIGADDRR